MIIESVENEFIVRDGNGSGMLGKKWAFETPKALAAFLHEWGVSIQIDRDKKDNNNE